VSAPGGVPLDEHGGGVASAGLFGFAVALFGLVGGLPLVIGPAVGVGGIVASSLWRRSPRGTGRALPIVPAIAGIAVLAVTAPATPAAELFGGLAALAFLVWLADDPARPRGGGRRAAPVVMLVALTVGLSWAITLAVPGRGPEIAVAGGLLAAAFVLLALLLSRPQVLLNPSGRKA
jgi:hypothetical protein